MVGRLFGSPSQHGGGAAPLNTPKSQSRKERIEQARQDRSRRRNFGFLKTGTSEKAVVSSNILSKRREHAKQLANLAYSDDPAFASNVNSLTPTSRYAHQQLLSSLDVESPVGTAQAPLDPFSTAEIPQFSITNTKGNHGLGLSTSNTSLFLDAQRHLGPDREPTASTVDTFDTSSVGSAFDLDFVAAAGKATAGLSSPLPAFRAVYAGSNAGTSGSGSRRKSRSNHSQKSGNVSLDNYFVESSERNTISMPTIPSNSSMQATNVYQRGLPTTATGSFSSTASNSQQQRQRMPQQVHNQSLNGGSSNSSVGVAARRRMRSHMRNQTGSNSSVGSASSYHHPHIHNSNNNDANSLDASFASSAPSTPPESPASVRHIPSGSSASKNRLAPYQHQYRAGNTNNASNVSFHSTGGASFESSSVASSSPNIFDSEKLDGGFTFDAFGLDQSQVEREVNEAMQELAGQGIAGFSILVDKKTISSGLRKDSFMVQSDDDFTPQAWDTSPISSRNASPVPSTVQQDGQDFVDGFRINQPTAPGAVNGYGKSMETKTSNRQGSSSFFISTNSNTLTEVSKRRLQRSLNRGTTIGGNNRNNRNNVSNHVTPPRWEVAATSASPQTASEAFQDSAVSNPWKEDPWASDDGGNATGSDFGGQDETLSDVHDYRGSFGTGGSGRFNIRGGRPSYSDAKSDIGVGPHATYRPMFYQLPPEEDSRQNADDEEDDQTDHSDDLSQFQEDLTHEFANEFIRRSESPRPDNAIRGGGSGRSNTTKRVLNYGGDDTSNQNMASDQTQPSKLQSENATTPSLSSKLGHSDSLMPNEQSQFDLKSRHQSGQSEITRSDARNRLVQEKLNNFSSDFASTSNPLPPQQRVSRPIVPYSDEEALAGKREKLTEREVDGSLPNYGSLRSSYDVAKSQMKSGSSRSGQESEQPPDFPTVRPKHQPKESDTRVEEKKDDDEISTKLPLPKVGSLRARWEAKTRNQTEAGGTAASVEPLRLVRKSETQGRLQTLDNEIEMLTPDIVDARRVEKKKSRTEYLRKSLGVDANTRVLCAQSAVHDSIYDRSVANRILDHVRKNSHFDGSSPGTRSDAKSDGGSTPSYLANVKLRNVSSPPSNSSINIGIGSKVVSPITEVRTPSYRDRKAWGQNDDAASSNEDAQHKFGQAANKLSGRNLSYRERREIELQREKVEKAKLESTTPDPPKKDVASLIRKRIAANKQKCSSLSKESPSNEITGIPIQLKPAEKENISQGESLSNQMTTSPTPSQLSSALPNDASSYHTTSSRFQQRNDSPMISTHDCSNSPLPAEIHQMQKSPIKRRESPKFGVAMPNSSAYGNFERDSQDHDISDTVTSTSISRASKVFQGFQHSPTKSSPLTSPSQHSNSVDNKVETVKGDKQEIAKKDARAVKPDVRQKVEIPDEVSTADVKSMLSSFLGSRAPPALPLPTKDDDTEALKKHHVSSPSNSPPSKDLNKDPPPPPPPTYKGSGNRPALKDDPKFERYFRMLKMGLPLEVAKHAMVRDGLDPSVLDLDHDKPIGVPLKEDPKFEKYFKMIKIGISMNQVKHAMERDGLNPDIMDQDHNLPVITVEKPPEKKNKETHRRARLHWRTIGNIVRNSLWAKVETEVHEIEIDEEEFNELFKADLKDSSNVNKTANNIKKKGAAVRVIDAKRANNGGIILARLKMTHDEMADAVDRIDSDALSAEQIENIIEYLPTKEERDALEQYMLEGGQDAAEKFDGLCECEKFMVSMMTVKHAKRKIRALLFKLQFMSCMESIAEDARTIDNACDELSHSNRLRQLFGIILQFGNRLNTAGVNNKGKVGAFTLDSLLKLSQAKAFDKKTTFLHYIILIVQRNNEILLNYYDDLPTVLKADKVFWDQCLQDLEEVENQLENVRRISLYEARMKKQYQLQRGNKSDDDSLSEMELTLEEEVESLRATPTGLFTLGAIKQVSALRDKIERTKGKFERVLEYFGEDTRKMQPHELFNIISAFTRDFQKAKEEVFSTVQKKLREERKKARSQTPSEKNVLPPARPSGSKPSALLKASDHQPNMSKLYNESKQRSASSFPPHRSQDATTPSYEAQQPSEPKETSDAQANEDILDSLNRGHFVRPAGRDITTQRNSSQILAFRNMQYQSEIPEERSSAISSPSNEAKAAQGQLEQRRVRHQEPFAAMRNGVDDVGKGRATSSNLAPQIRSTNVMNASATGSSIRSPRDALRNRRRLEALRSRYPTSNNPSSNAAGVD